MDKLTVKVPSGTVPATHTHLNYGPCIIVPSFQMQSPTLVMIRTNYGTAMVPRSTLSEIKESK